MAAPALQLAEVMDATFQDLRLQEQGKPAIEPMNDNVLTEDDDQAMSSVNDEEEQEADWEEEWSEEDDRPTQYDLRQYGVYQSLPIPPGPPDLQADCNTAEEYLKRVR